MEMDLINVKNLKAYFYLGKGLLSRLFGQGLRIVHAVDDVDLTIKKGRTFGLVGESGCGKTTLGKAIFRLVEVQEGEIYFEERDVLKAEKAELKYFRQKAQLIFQDSYSSLNPRMTAWEIIAEPIQVYRTKASNQIETADKVAELLDAVSLPYDAVFKFPHEFSGGQARRIGVARALSLDPVFIVADEPTSGLDISTAATILNLMQELQEKWGLTYLWISHNLDQVKYMSDDIAVMYLGQIVETGRTTDVLGNMAHPYTKALISAIPSIKHGTRKEKIILEGEIPSPINPPSGCRFRTRCSYVMDRCRTEPPGLIDLGSGHYARCHLLGDA